MTPRGSYCLAPCIRGAWWESRSPSAWACSQVDQSNNVTVDPEPAPEGRCTSQLAIALCSPIWQWKADGRQQMGSYLPTAGSRILPRLDTATSCPRGAWQTWVLKGSGDSCPRRMTALWDCRMSSFPSAWSLTFFCSANVAAWAACCTKRQDLPLVDVRFLFSSQVSPDEPQQWPLLQ